MEEIIGYKGMHANLKNKYGEMLKQGIWNYSSSNTIKFGMGGSGYHFCSHLEDTFRYFSSTEDTVCCKVVGSGDFIRVSDFAYQAEDMYVAEKIKIVDILTREKIFEYALTCDIESLERLLALYCFNQEELKSIKKRCTLLKKEEPNLLKLLKEIQTGDPSTFTRSRKFMYGGSKAVYHGRI